MFQVGAAVNVSKDDLMYRGGCNAFDYTVLE